MLHPPQEHIAGTHDDVIKWKHFPRYWPFVGGIHRSPVNSPHKGQWRGALMFTLICTRINGWVNNREAGDLRRHRAHYDVIVMLKCPPLATKHATRGVPTEGHLRVIREMRENRLKKAEKLDQYHIYLMAGIHMWSDWKGSGTGAGHKL